MLELATSLGFKILPLYVTIVASYKVDLNFAVAFLPIVLFLLSSTVSLLSLRISSNFFHDNIKKYTCFFSRNRQYRLL